MRSSAAPLQRSGKRKKRWWEEAGELGGLQIFTIRLDGALSECCPWNVNKMCLIGIAEFIDQIEQRMVRRLKQRVTDEFKAHQARKHFGRESGTVFELSFKLAWRQRTLYGEIAHPDSTL